MSGPCLTGFPPYREGLFPGYWRDEQTDLPACVEAYLNFCCQEGPEPTHYQLKRVIWFIQWFINAPCWEPPQDAEWHDHIMSELTQLRERANTLASLESIRRWTDDAMDIGIDPW